MNSFASFQGCQLDKMFYISSTSLIFREKSLSGLAFFAWETVTMHFADMSDETLSINKN